MPRFTIYFKRYVDQLRSIDWLMMLAMFVLLLFGVSSIYSVDLSFASGDFLNTKKQLIAIGIGFGFVLWFSLSNYKLLRNYSTVMYFIGILLLIGVLLFGENIRGAQGWFVFGPVSFQPVEYVKIALIVALATYFGKHSARRFNAKILLGSLFIVIIPVVLVLMQPDFGSAFILLGIWFLVILLAGLPFRYLFTLVTLGAVFFVLAWSFVFADYQKARLITFVNPTYDPLGQGYNVQQAIIAVGSGGWFGRGLGFGSQSQLKYLPESQTDFIFAVIAEELGFVGVILLFLAFILLFSRLFHYVKKTYDNFTIFLLLGIIIAIFLQLLVNVGMNLGLFPVTGIGLPFVSYGGSSMVFFMLLIGIAQSISMNTRLSGS